jgi:hypothetical protein
MAPKREEDPMHRPDAKLSPETFERLIARAAQIDEQGKERIDLVQARQIATELGVSGPAWDAAVQEWVSGRPDSLPPTDAEAAPSFAWRRVGAAAIAGGVAGIVMGLIASASSGDDIAIGSTLIATALGLGGYEYLRRSFRQAQASIAAWWISAVPGIATIGMSGVSSDAVWYALFSWAGCGLTIAIVDVLARRSRQESGNHGVG